MKYTKVIDDLKNSTKSIEFLLAGISQNESEYREDIDRWSILEIVCHLLDIEKKDFKYEFEMIIIGNEVPWPSFDIEELRIKNKYNERTFIEVKQQFFDERDKSLKWLSSIDQPELTREHFQKIVDGRKIKAGDILASWVAHDLFHIRQIALAKWFVLNKEVAPFSSKYSGFTV